MDISLDAVIAMAPDDASVKAARGLVSPEKWPLLGFDETAVWGVCRGSGSKPYQVKIELSGPTCSCSCPSRKIPCKHALALLMLRAGYAPLFTVAERPDWVAEWLDARRQRAARQEEKKERRAEQAKADPAAAARREKARLERIRGGLDELERWICDQVQHGLSQLSGQYDVWDKLAARMVDAQAPGMAARLRALGGIVDRGEEWPAVLLGKLGMLQLLIDAFRHPERLSPSEQADLRAALGIVPDTGAVRDGTTTGAEHIEDIWHVLGVSHAEEDRLWRRRVWLYGRSSGRLALLLDFSHGSRQFEHFFSPGDTLRMNLAFHPGSAPLRAFALDAPEPVAPEPGKPSSTHTLPGSLPQAVPTTVEDALMSAARTLAANPWRLPLPLVFNGARLCRRENEWALLTDAGRVLPLDMTDNEAWELLAESGGLPLFVCGEWDGARLRIAGAFAHAEAKESV